MSIDSTARGLAGIGLKNAASALALTTALAVLTAEPAAAIMQSISEYSTERTLGVPVPKTGTAAANSHFVYNAFFEEAGQVIEFSYFCIGGSGDDQVNLDIIADAGTDWERVSRTSHPSVQNTLVTNTLGNGFDELPTFEAGQTWGTYSHFGGSARIPYVSNGAPISGYWEQTGGDKSGAFPKGDYVTTRTMQVRLVVRYASGRIVKLLDSIAGTEVQQFIVGRNSSETVGDFTGLLTASNNSIDWDPIPLPRAGLITRIEFAADTPDGINPAPMRFFFCEVGADGNATDIYHEVVVNAEHGYNDLNVTDGTLPLLISRSARQCFIGVQCSSNGARLRTAQASGTEVPSAGYGLESTISGKAIGANTFIRNTSQLRFDLRVTMQAIKPKVATKTIYSRTFGGSVRPWDVNGNAADLVFGPTGIKAAPGAFGISKGCKGVVEEALNKNFLWEIITLGAYDAPTVGKRTVSGLYGTAVVLDVATDTITVASLSGNSLGSTNPARLAAKVNPFPGAPLVAGDRIHVLGWQEDRAAHLKICRENGDMVVFTAADLFATGSSGEKSLTDIAADTLAKGTSLTMDLNAWYDETDMRRMGMWKGTWFFANNRSTSVAWATGVAKAVGDMVSQGGSYYYAREAHTTGDFATDLAAGKWGLWASSELHSVLHMSDVLDSHKMQGSDSMADSRRPFWSSWFGRIRSRVEAGGKKMALNSVHGVTSIAHRVQQFRLVDYMENLDGFYFCYGMNDVDEANPSATAAVMLGQASLMLYQLYDRGVRLAIADIFLTFIPAGNAANNDGNKLFNAGLAAMAPALNAARVTFQTTASIDHAGVYRLESWFNGLADAHLGNGHEWADDQTAWQASEVLETSPGPVFRRPYMLPFAWAGTQSPGECLERWKITEGLSVSRRKVETEGAIARVAATASTTITFKIDGATVMTVVFAAGQAVGAVTVSNTRWGPGVLEITTTGDATLADASVTITGDRN